MRIGYACKLLVERERSIAQVSALSGFSNISYFHRQFKKVTGMAPGVYRRQYDDFSS
jgi:AraC-like DNA-binding protein